MAVVEMRDALGLEALRGQCADALQPVSGMVRVYISSTHSDMKSERNAFWERAYSQLQAHCQSLALVFEVVDFRWGVHEIISADHMITELCVNEIESCQSISDGPTFIALLGNQYGHRPIPRLIPETEFELLLSKLSKDQESLKLLNQWFSKDSNSVPPTYILQPITTHYTHYNDRGSDNGQLRDDDVISWNVTESRILQALRTAALQAERDGDMSVEHKHKFFKSVMEYEMEHGFLKTQRNASAVVFFREMPRLSKKDCKKNFAKFLLDITADGLLDTEARELLANLKQRISKTGHLQPLCMELSKGAMDPSRKEHKEYLANMCEKVISQMKELISRHALPATGCFSSVDPGWTWLKQEIFHHAVLSKEKCSVFRGRDSILGKISITMWESTHTCHAPLLVHGPSGVGKTALLCKLAQEMRAVLDQRAVVVLRLLGTSPLSSNVDSVLRGVCLQVCGALGLQLPCPHIANTHEELIRFFHSMLNDVSEQGDTLLLILDSMEKLLEANKPHILHWIPKEIPPNVHIVLSTSDDCIEIHKSLVSEEKNIFEVELLTADQGNGVIDAYMNAAGRKLTSEQLDSILLSFQQSGNPLHLKLMLNTAKQWPSHTSMSNVHLGISVQEVLAQFVQSLEENHGKKLVSHALSFILLSRHGLSEAELQDVLSLDNDVLAEIYKFWLPPNHTLLRFPRIHWSRLRHDLRDHLTERWEGGIILLGFSHRQFTELVRERYLSSDMKTDMHTILAEYFSGQWSKSQLRPILLPSLTTLLNADRKVSPQPLWFTGEAANMRKLHELPYHLAHAGKWEELNQSVLGSLDWLCCKTLCCGVSCVIQDLSICTSLTDCPEIQMLKETFLLLKPALDFRDGHADPSLLVTEIFTRLHGLADLYPSMIGRLCSQCVDWFGSCTDPVLVPKCSFFQAPGGPLKSTLTGFTKGVRTVVLCSKRELLVAGSEDGLIIAWSLKHLQTLHTLSGHMVGVLSLKLMDKTTNCLSTGLDGTLRKWCLISGQQLFCIPDAVSVQTHTPAHVHMNEERKIIISNPRGLVKAWHLDTAEPLYEVTASVCSVLGVMGDAIACMCSEGMLCFYDVSTGTQNTQTPLPCAAEDHSICSLTLTKHSKILIAEEGHLHVVWSSGIQSTVDLPSPALFLSSSDDEKLLFAGCDRTLCVFLVSLTSMHKVLDLRHDASVLCAVSKSEGSEIITSAQDRIIRVWSVTTGALLDWISGMDSVVSSLAVHQHTIISASVISNSLKLWHLDYNTCHKSKTCIPAHCSLVVLSKEGDSVFYVKEGNKTEVFTWSCSEGETCLLSDSMDASSEVCCLELAQQKRLLFCGLRTGTILIYPLDFAPETLCLPPPESLPTVRSMAVSPQEDRMAVVYEDVVCLFEITSRDSFPCVDGPFERYSLCLLHSPISAMALLSDCRLLYGTFGGEVVIYDFKTATTTEMDHHGAAITCITMSNWDSHALIGSQDCVQKLWNLRPVLLDHTMEYKGFYFEGVLCAVFSKNDKYVFTGSLDKTIKVWDVSNGCLLYIQYVYSPVIKMMPHKDGFVAVSQHGSFIKEGFRCPDSLKPGYNPLQNFRAHYRVTSREKSLNAPHTVVNELPEYNPAQFSFIGMMKTKPSNTCVLL
ncbi:NACHT domain- and WD repeat-containing protein 1 [Myxocyprinus asiaticus]|uniref:NACHT domain- and WD repeat-containing protein 1 n=1 Tax=Myxocyprinus asiaticus TaxID=70543 RepID=UPI0022231338|nr:NACHT domain- and WD repeat-containing protein 1 [Myxocyprinus asiaticus]